MTQCSNKATMASLNQDVIARIPYLAPDRTILREFHDFAYEILNQIANCSGNRREQQRAATCCCLA